MEEHKAIIERFYTAFQRGDYATMQSLYARDAYFYDPVFQELTGEEAGKMWEMLLRRSKDLKISLGKVEATPEGGTAIWKAQYPFGKKARLVNNRIKATFTIRDGLIIRHEDDFDLRKWMNQALGWQGKYLGGLPFLRKQVQQQAQKSLQRFMQKALE
jgi:ketosteroid isomerase-like protein